MFATLKDGSRMEFSRGVTVGEIAKALGDDILDNAVCGRVNGEAVDLSYIVEKDSDIEILSADDKEGLEVYRHTCAQILAQAVKSIFPTCKLASGAVLENGFYYDFDFVTPLTLSDLNKIEGEMRKIIKSDLPISRMELSRDEAIKLFFGFKENYKVELCEEMPKNRIVCCYKQGAFVDLCKGPHLLSTGKMNFIKLTSIAGAYWRGNENNKMLTRIYGTAFPDSLSLEEYLNSQEEAKKREHIKLGRDLGLFATEETIGQGLPMLLPKGAKVIRILSRFIEDEEERRGFMPTKTPCMAKSDLFKMSGHWRHYRDAMFVIGDEKRDEEVFALRPMAYPFQYQIYKNGQKSYRDLPCRYAETATLFRNEVSGEMHGLIRLRQFTLSDELVICTLDQLEEEFGKCLDLCMTCLKALGMDKDISFRFSKRGKRRGKYIDNAKAWKSTQTLMRQILDRLGLEYTEADDEAEFYGPKLDIQTRNVFGREDTLMTIKLDFSAAAAFNLSYIDQNGEKCEPYVIHSTSIGCYERTLAMLIEKYSGAFPLWISPVQVKVLSVTDKSLEYAKNIADRLSFEGLRTVVDVRGEKIGKKIREAQLEKVPYMVVIGSKEVKNGNTLSVRERSGESYEITIDEFIANLLSENKNKIIE